MVTQPGLDSVTIPTRWAPLPSGCLRIAANKSPSVLAGKTDSGRITIPVSHRFSTVRMADLIVVLGRARLVEFDTHDELMAKGG